MPSQRLTKADHPTKTAEQTAYGLLFLVCLGHFLNDGIQSVIPAALPILRDAHGLTFTQVGLITLVIQVTSSLLQPLVGLTTDKHPTKYMLAIGMCSTLVGLVALSQASVFASMLLAVAFLGFGSAVFHPEATRIAQFASGGRKGLAQSVFQVGGNAGMALGPLAAAFVVIPYGQASIAWFGIAAGLAAIVMLRVGTLAAVTTSPSKSSAKLDQSVTCRALRGSLLVDVLQTGLHCLPTELSDVLFDRHIRHDHIGQPIRAFRLSGDERYRDNRRRPADRSLRQPCRHSLFDTRRRTVHAHDSSRRTSDIRLFGSGRVVHHVIGLFRHSRLCA